MKLGLVKRSKFELAIMWRYCGLEIWNCGIVNVMLNRCH